MTFAALGLGVIIVALWLLAPGGGSNLPGVEIPLARFRVSDVQVDDSCSSLFDHCVRVACMVANVGLADGTATVSVELNPYAASHVEAVESVYVPAGQSRAVSHDFPQASAFERNQGMCSIR